MKKTLLAIMLAGTAFASQAGTLVSQGTEASANLTLTKPIVVNNTIQPVKGVYSGTLTAWTPLATGIVGASDGQSHDYAHPLGKDAALIGEVVERKGVQIGRAHV